jgi:hypothetical protein
MTNRNRTSAVAEIEFHIGQLVLGGFHAGDRHQIASAMQTELTRLLAHSEPAGLPRNSLELDHLNAGVLQVESGMPPHRVGRNAAQQLFRHLSRASAADVEGGPTHV